MGKGRVGIGGGGEEKDLFEYSWIVLQHSASTHIFLIDTRVTRRGRTRDPARMCILEWNRYMSGGRRNSRGCRPKELIAPDSSRPHKISLI